ncbi:PTS sugar transporter subunit IIA [Enterococcus faecium]|nr:PTS sugar transporter subunit IIA [Enterococcus faecium]NVD80496.1 PTS sugar transporter subunit IIA [Enterococcus faecium]NVD84492.1 PTS sugar transporter subunit IIA [Enterococcus faecium]NVE05762.1 PTS sugar transporter subunit IIA [Enterococcus faecium]NVE08022.1 PTS sugar transporter subunit IIA [Enterococcus faecium]
MKDEFIERIEVSVTSQREAYHWLASSLYPGEEEKISILMEAFLMREQNGNIQIEEGIILPHIEHELITESKIIILYPKKTIIQWNEAIEQVDLILFVLLSPNENTEKKEENSKFYEMFSGRNIYANIKENKER